MDGTIHATTAQQRVIGGVDDHVHLELRDIRFDNLDSVHGQEVMELLQSLNKEGTTIVMVTHDAAMAERTSRTIRIFDGRQVQ